MRDRLLFVSQSLPYPPDSGVKIRSYHTLKVLSEAYDVTALCFFRRQQSGGDKGVREAVEALSEFAEVSAFPIPQEWSRSRWVRDHAASVFSRRPYTDFVFDEPGFSTTMRRAVATGSFAIAHLESLSLGPYADRLTTMRTVCVHHNVESQLLERRARVQTNHVAGSYIRHQARLLRQAEQRLCPTFNLNVTVSETDADTFRGLVPGARFEPIPNGVDVDRFAPCPGETSGVALLGGTDWFPNLDGLAFFAEQVLPRVRERVPGVTVVSVGRANSAEIKRYWERYGIKLTGYVDDIRPIIARARCVAVPLRVGGGSRLKILDSWAMGKSIVTTTVGCEGLSARDGENALIRDDPDSFAAAVVSLLENEVQARHLAIGARSEAVERYSWTAIGERMLSLYAQLLS